MALIKKLHVRGFKSFAKPTDLEFGNGYNVVIGPNGAGKSNVGESICFVLGKLSAKSMRVEKSSNLIFNGGKKLEPMKEAEVSVVFDNGNKEFPVASDDVKITRIVKQSGNSVYKINGEVRTREQILELLAAAKIDPDGHNIIMQGDIVRFMEMRTEERRELIEEIAGISIYEDRKNKALHELEKVEGKLNEAGIILTEREAYLRELKKERDQALKYKELERNVKSNKATFLYLQMEEKKKKLQDAEGKLASQQEALQKIDEKVSAVKHTIEMKKQELQTTNKEIEEKGEKESVALQNTIETLKTEIVRNTEKLASCKQVVQRAEQRKRQLATSLQETKNTISYLESTKKEMVAQLGDLQKKEKACDTHLQRLRKQSGSDVSRLESVEKELDALLLRQERLLNKRQELLQKKFHIDSKVAIIDERLRQAADLEKKANVDNVSKELRDVCALLEKQRAERDVLRNQLDETKASIMKQDGELFKLRALHTNTKESVLGDRAIGKILNLKKPGVYGTVSQLGTVDRRYGLALEVAAGARIKSIVVDDDAIAGDCITLLKQERVGVATFLPLNKIQERLKTRLKGEGILGHALDLVSFDRKFALAFSYVFGNTFVVDTLATARRIGIGKVRMVTLDGDLVETSGAMIGGYRSRGVGFRERDVQEDLTRLEKELEKLEKLHAMIEKRAGEADAETKKLSDRKNALEGLLIKARNSVGFNVDTLRKEREDLLQHKVFKDVEAVDRELGELSRTVEDFKKERERYKGALANLQGTRAGSELRTMETRRVKFREESVQLTADIKNIEVQLANIYAPELEKLAVAMRETERELETLATDIASLEQVHKQQQAALKGHESDENRFQKAYKNLFLRRNKVTEEIQRFEGSLEGERERIKLVNERMNDLSIARAKIVAEHEALAKEFEEFRGVELRHHISLEKLKDEIKRFEQLITQMGNVNLRALEVYESIKRDYDEILNKIATLNSEKDDVLRMMQEIEGKKKDLFLQTYNLLADHFTRIFSTLSTKGEALLELENTNDPLIAGVEIKVRIAGDRFLDIRSLSGGEKTLAALAFIFAIQEFQPASFYLFDEVDAALDKKNSELLSRFIEKYSQKAQYIIISHNDQVITEADYIYGVSMHESGMSKVVSLKV